MIDSSNDHYILDIARARSLLGWEPKHNLRETLPTIVAALKRHPRAWYRNNKLNENLVAWNDNSVSKLAELDPHKPEAAAGEMAGMVHGAMDHEIGRAHVCTPVTNAHLVCRLLLEKKKKIHS